MKKYYAGIDSGTTGTTVMIFDESGQVMSSGYAEYDTKHPHPGWVDQDMNELWEGVHKAAKKATSRFKGDINQVVSIGLSSQRGSFVPIDENWEPLLDAIVWSDGRATKEARWIEQNIGRDRYYEISGLIPSSLWAFSKIKWLKDNEPEVYKKAWKIVSGQEWILNKLGSKEVFTVPSALNLHGIFDIKTLDYSDELLQAIDLDKEKLPPIVNELRVVGEVSEEASKLTGFAVGTKLGPGGGDQLCAAVGSGVNKEGMAELSIGTASVVIAQLDKAPNMPEHLQSGVSFGSHAIPGKWAMEGIIQSAGACLRWWRDTYGQVEVDLAEKLDISSYDLITLQAKQAPAGCRGLIFFPFFNSQSTPYYHDNARGGLIGLSQMHNRGYSARAVMEGIVYELRMAIEAMETSLKRPFDTIRLSGGGARSDFWNQMQADIYGRSVEVLKVSECATLGAAILGAVGSQEIETVDVAIDKMVHTHGFIEPNMETHKVYTDMYEIFKKTFLALVDANIYNELSDVVMKNKN